ncbi:MAG: hypothetical protein ACOX6U_02870 [Oscillospiraceae bacterium]|jgi:hypothetical protein
MQVNLEHLRKMAGGGYDLPPGGYVCRILKVDDVAQRQCLRVYYDIEEGEYQNYFGGNLSIDPLYKGLFYECYREHTLSYFARFINAVQDSNPDYEFDGNEKTLLGKLIGLVLREEEYINKAGYKERKLGVALCTNVERIRKKDFPTFSPKLLL